MFCALLSHAQDTIEVSITVPDGKLFGTLTIADGLEVSPVVLVVAGSGATDRNMGKGMSYKMLSDSLLKHNISSLRVDKRTSGESRKHMNNSDDLSFDDFVDDVKAWISFLKSDKRFSKLIVLGHSQGSLIALLTAQNSKVDKCISLAGAGEPIDLVLRKQIYDPPINKFFFGPVIDTLFERIKQHDYVETDSIPLPFQGMFNKRNQPFLASWIKYDPALEIKKVNVPTLIVQGEMDFQVQMDQYNFLKNAQPMADTLLVKNMNHAMKYADTLDKIKNSKNYDDPDIGLINEFIPPLVEFILKP